jgi:hypothetical protein
LTEIVVRPPRARVATNLRNALVGLRVLETATVTNFAEAQAAVRTLARQTREAVYHSLLLLEETREEDWRTP